jgi:phosphodiesterase/alkaline phosphatase D-like protein
MSDVKIKRREFVKKAAYAAPVILTLKAMPAFAASGSGGNPRSRGGAKGDPSETKASKAPAKS